MKEDTVNINFPKSFAAIITGITALHSFIPNQIEYLTLSGLCLIIIDGITGLAVAAAYGNISSTKARLKLIAKSAQYFGLLGLSAIVSLLAQTWLFYGAGWASLCAIEAISVMENLVRLEGVGVKLGPAKPLLRRISKFFAEFKIIDDAESVGKGEKLL